MLKCHYHHIHVCNVQRICDNISYEKIHTKIMKNTYSDTYTHKCMCMCIRIYTYIFSTHNIYIYMNPSLIYLA